MQKSYLIAIVLSAGLVSTAHADKAAKTDTAKLTHDNVKVRSSHGKLASARAPRISLKDSKKQTSKTESRFVRTASGQLQAAATKKTMNPYQLAFANLQAKAAQVAPSQSGRVEVSFTVGKDGHPKKVNVFGFDSKLDSQLAAVLQKQTFPKKDAGQFMTSKLTLRAVKAAPTKSSKRAKKSRKRTRRAKK